MTEREISRLVRTNAGMCALWRPESFEFEEFEEWEDWATDNRNLVDSMISGDFVPINVGGDGVFQVSVRWGENVRLAEDEHRCLLVSSDPYLLLSEGWFVVGGLEDVGDVAFSSANRVYLPRGRYAVRVHLIDWKIDPASVDAGGQPTQAALPDFVILIASESGGPYRTKVQTFERR
ncbi:hypothetical protein [Microtetraspora glauca]|uniref:Wzt C-terminal domain-containing protein n=1 Tax=Microtetraspora glauca TaxID=1996 RepID=A0ABV3GHM4_MICGL